MLGTGAYDIVHPTPVFRDVGRGKRKPIQDGTIQARPYLAVVQLWRRGSNPSALLPSVGYQGTLRVLYRTIDRSGEKS